MSKLKNRKLQRCMEIVNNCDGSDFGLKKAKLAVEQLKKIYAGDCLSSDDDTEGDTCTKNARAC